MFTEKYIKESLFILENLSANKEFLSEIENIANVIIKSFRNNGKILIAGNGGSAADAQHMAAEFVAKFYKKRKALPAIALTTNTSVLTAISNDNGYETLFSRQLEALGKNGDIFFAISTSGNSQNIINALKTAKQSGLINIGLTGEKACKMESFCDYLIKVPSTDTPHIQEVHILIEHIICAITENNL